MASVIKIKWEEGDFTWNSSPPSTTYKPGYKPNVFPYTWDDVALVVDLVSGGYEDIDKVDKEKKKRLIRLIMKRNGIKEYDEEKEVKNIKAKVKDVELIIKEVRSSIKIVI